jgi:hypothetical protein
VPELIIFEFQTRLVAASEVASQSWQLVQQTAMIHTRPKADDFNA